MRCTKTKSILNTDIANKAKCTFSQISSNYDVIASDAFVHCWHKKTREPFVKLKLKNFIWQVTVLKPLKRNRMEQENVNNRALSPTRWHYQSQVKVIVFLNNQIFYEVKKVLAFIQDRCCHHALCLQLIVFHYGCQFLLL